MQIRILTENSAQRTLLLFLGWGISASQLPAILSRNYKIVTLEDYSDYSADAGKDYFKELAGNLEDAREIAVMAWSFGVRIATDFLLHYRGALPVTCTVAVNGTPFHIDDRKGIPTAVFNGTLENLSPANLKKFNRRMFGNAAELNEFSDRTTERDFDNLKDELRMFAQLPPSGSELPGIWERAVVCSDDRIFPWEAQQAAWEALSVPVRIIDGSHFPDFQHLVDTELVDKSHVASSFGKALATYAEAAQPQTIVAKELWALLEGCKINRPARGRMLEIGCGSGLLTDIYVPELPGWDIELWDIAETREDLRQNYRFMCCDAETEVRNLEAESFDLIISSSCLQWFNSPARFIEEASKALKPGGVLAVALYGDQTYREIASLTGRTLAYPSMQALVKAAERSGLEIMHSSEEVLPVEFDSPREMLRHIKLTGVSAVSSRSGSDIESAALNVSGLRLLKYLAENLEADGGKCKLTYHPIYLIARKETVV